MESGFHLSIPYEFEPSHILRVNFCELMIDWLWIGYA